jgi:hypothetical protein
MFDRSACAKACLAADAHVDLTALAALAPLLRHLREARLAPSNASVLSVPILSRDQNRGELDATSNDVEVGAPPCAATDADSERLAGFATIKARTSGSLVPWNAGGGKFGRSRLFLCRAASACVRFFDPALAQSHR